MNRIKLVVPLLAIAMAGCKTVNTVEPVRPSYQVDVLTDRRITTDPFLADKAHVLQVRQATVQGDLLKVDVEVENTKLWQGDIDYAFDWYDGQGMPFDTPLSTWVSKSVGPGETVSLVAVAPSPQCKDFRLKLRRSLRD